MTERVNILGQESADKDALAVLREFLMGHGIEVNEEFNETSTTIALGEEGHLAPDVKKMEGELTTLNNSDIGAEGYVLNIEYEASELSQGGTIFFYEKNSHSMSYRIMLIFNLGHKSDNL